LGYPTLQGKPWLEKPVLYYWQAMLSFRLRPASPTRLPACPAAFDAALLIVVILSVLSAAFARAVNWMAR
jgi:hypothetical protein